MKINSAISSTSVWTTMIAGRIGTALGTASASGRTTSELRVAALNASARPSSAFKRVALDTAHPSSGANTANAT